MALLSGWDLRQAVETRGYYVVGPLVDVDQGFEHMMKFSLLVTASRLLQGAMRLLQGASAGGNAAAGSG
jgi:hypothetical protein